MTPVLLLLGPKGSRLERLPFAGMGLMALAAVALVWRVRARLGPAGAVLADFVNAWLRAQGPATTHDETSQLDLLFPDAAHHCCCSCPRRAACHSWRRSRSCLSGSGGGARVLALMRSVQATQRPGMQVV